MTDGEILYFDAEESGERLDSFVARMAEVTRSRAQKLIDDGHKIYIVTCAEYESLRVKMDEVLFKYFPFFTWKDVIIASKKQMIKADILVDDGVHNHVGGDYIKLLYTAPHNCEYDAEANGMVRVGSWREVYEFISQLSEEG